ncbi:S1/P1 nuclease [Labrys monachus]|uniref:Endonuclease n=1 Tax=Labrys monachus TaxID=217067 RepID=A0ABU0F909_9HYPH|nr:S1/P1 nuclease [Labrys monachus]MDQ0390857.1 hypothetical protein [Labrys monachus]
MAFFLASAMALASIGSANAWGDRGHSIVAEIAQHHLNPQAAAAVQKLIGPSSMAGVASWADDFKNTPAGTGTKPWHYVDIDIAKPGYSEDDCKGSCLVSALRDQSSLLADIKRSDADRRKALLMVIHLVGDSTQPFHCSERNGDGGANNVDVFLRINGPDGKELPILPTNLHAVWDESLVNARAYGWGGYADDLDSKVLPTLPSPRTDQDFAKAWIDECHIVAQGVYALTPPSSRAGSKAPIALGPDYQKAAEPVLDKQLATGGLRLAALLNKLLGP